MKFYYDDASLAARPDRTCKWCDAPLSDYEAKDGERECNACHQNPARPADD